MLQVVRESCLVTSNKGSLGHTLGAAGALESVFSVLSLVEVFHFEQRVLFFNFSHLIFPFRVWCLHAPTWRV